MMPIPPSCASPIARRASVTVSMAAETIGMLMRMPREKAAAVLTSRGSTFECAGTSRTSSKVSVFAITFFTMALLVRAAGCCEPARALPFRRTHPVAARRTPPGAACRERP